MNNYLKPFAIGSLIVCLAACSPPAQEPDIDLVVLKQEIQQHTERLYWIHLRLDTASTEIADAQAAAQEGNVSAAGYHAGEAYRSIERADEALLELGEQLQKMVNLDQR
jgi:hypothetical protein